MGSGTVALRLAAAQEHSEPFDVNDEGLVDNCRSQKSCCGCMRSDRDNVYRVASLQHTLADRQVVQGSSRWNRYRRQRSRDVIRAAPFAGDGTQAVVTAPLCGMARDV